MSERTLGAAELRVMRLGLLRQFVKTAKAEGWSNRAGTGTKLTKRAIAIVWFEGAYTASMSLACGGIGPKIVGEDMMFRMRECHDPVALVLCWIEAMGK